MDAFPQLARCFTAQWRGLHQTERVRLRRAWAHAAMGAMGAGYLKAPSLSQAERPIWQVYRSGGESAMTLIGIKTDHLPDFGAPPAAVSGASPGAGRVGGWHVPRG